MEFQTQEEQIVRRCQQGELEEFAKLYDAYANKLYRFVYYKTSHKETAEDITSDVFVKALKAINRFKSGKGTFQAWLFSIARNTVIDYYRTKKNLLNIDDVYSLKQDSSILRDLDNKELIKQVFEQFSKLSAEQREIIMLRVWENLPYKEIAEIMGKTEASSKMAFSRAVKKLKQEMLSALIILLIINLIK